MVKTGDYVIVIKEDKNWIDSIDLVGKIGVVVDDRYTNVSVDFLHDFPQLNFLHDCCCRLDSNRGYNLSKEVLQKVSKV